MWWLVYVSGFFCWELILFYHCMVKQVCPNWWAIGGGLVWPLGLSFLATWQAWVMWHCLEAIKDD